MSTKRATPRKESLHTRTALEIKKLIEESGRLRAETKQLLREFEVALRRLQNARHGM